MRLFLSAGTIAGVTQPCNHGRNGDSLTKLHNAVSQTASGYRSLFPNRYIENVWRLEGAARGATVRLMHHPKVLTREDPAVRKWSPISRNSATYCGDFVSTNWNNPTPIVDGWIKNTLQHIPAAPGLDDETNPNIHSKPNLF